MWRAESRGRRADTGRTTKGNGGRRTADGEKFLIRFSTAPCWGAFKCDQVVCFGYFGAQWHEYLFYSTIVFKTVFSPRFEECEASELKEGFLKFLEICMNRLKRISPRTPDERIKTYTSNVRNQQLMATNPRVNVSNCLSTRSNVTKPKLGALNLSKEKNKCSFIAM